jgi:hypothetical protein
MKQALIVTLLSTLTPLAAFANGDNLVTAFETYCLNQTGNMLVPDNVISGKTDRHQAQLDYLKVSGDTGYFMTSGGRRYLIEQNGKTCRVSTDHVLPNDVMKALATNHILTRAHGDNTRFGRAHWFEADHALTRYTFTHDLNDSTIVVEYQKDDAFRNGPVAITLTR